MTIGIVKSTLKIPPRHNGIIPIKIKGTSITGQTVCFISNQESRKGKDPNINIVEYTTSKAEQLLIIWYQIIAANMSHLARENT